MCGRFTLTWEEWRRVTVALRIDDDSDVAARYRRRFNLGFLGQLALFAAE
jgi:hypothetical protein